MAQYVDGFVIPIKKTKLKAYKKMALWGRKLWMKHGALSYYECVLEEYSKYGLRFDKMCQLKAGETAIFAFIVYKSKSHRNQVMKKVMKEMEQADPQPEMPFDMDRFSQAGFQSIVNS